MKIERYMFLSVLVHVELPGFKMYSLLLMQVLIWHAGHSQTITISAIVHSFFVWIEGGGTQALKKSVVAIKKTSAPLETLAPVCALCFINW